MQEIRAVQVHAFAEQPHAGSPAGVCFHPPGLPDSALRAIAIDLGPSVTAFVGPDQDGNRTLRWFTRGGREVLSYCGHATFAAAHTILSKDGESVEFATVSGLRLALRRGERVELEIPAWDLVRRDCPEALAASIGARPQEFLEGERDSVLIFEDADAISRLAPDFNRLRLMGDRGFICAAPGLAQNEIVFRFFCPGFSIGEDEDPATGSAHSSLAPYWLERLGSEALVAQQLSERGAVFEVRREDGRLTVTAPCATFFDGTIHI